MQLEVEYETSQAINMSCSNLLDYNGAPEVLTEELQLHLNSFAHETECEFGSLAVCQDCPCGMSVMWGSCRLLQYGKGTMLTRAQ